MTIRPIELMLSRVRQSSDSDALLFNELLLLGELILKLTTAAFVAAIEDDRDSHRYRILHALVRADGIGEWATKLDEILAGTTTQFISKEFYEDRRIFTERLGKEHWQYRVVSEIQNVLHGLNANTTPLPEKVALRSWPSKFAELRNKTRGHGAITAANCSRLVHHLKYSIDELVENNPIFKRPWAYLHRNLSGKYQVVSVGNDQTEFSKLKTSLGSSGVNFANGLYVMAGRPIKVELVSTDLDVSDFYLANGAFNGKAFELHSLITDNRLFGDAGPYVHVATDRPPSETEGASELEIVGNSFSNIPSVPAGYVHRPALEQQVGEIINNDRHPIITLVGRGGIGKTSLALTVLREVTKSTRFSLIVWFSARDIDLTLSGPKVVKPKVLADRDIAEEYKKLVEIISPKNSTNSALNILSDDMRKSDFGPILFIFDNFETVRNPVDLFQWIDTNIRLPNKVLITTRFREFKADFPIEITGMEKNEAFELIEQSSKQLKLKKALSNDEKNQIFEESNGHPYIIKIILGEIADSGSFRKPSNMIVRKDDMLDALFERTFANISPLAVHIFLMLSGWRSLVPQLAVEAVVLKGLADGGDPGNAIDELVRMSLVERTKAQDGADFLGVPITAAIFGTKKLQVNPYKEIIESDIRFIQEIGPTTTVALKEGIKPRILAFFKKIAKRISNKTVKFSDMRPVLEFVSRGYPPAWLLLADLTEEILGESGIEQTSEYVRRYLEHPQHSDETQMAWRRLMELYRKTNDVIAACSAFIRAADISEPPFYELSNIANWLNSERQIIDNMDVAERGAIFRPIAALMERHVKEATATELSRLGWLHLHIGNEARALEVADLGLDKEPENIYCQRLVEKLRT